MAENKKANLNDIGTTGLIFQNGVVEEEFLRELQGSKGALVYREMQNNDPILGGFLYAVHMLIRQITWTAKPSDPDIQASIEAAELLNSSMHGMQYSWKNTIDENLSMIPYGWAAHEVVYKKREDGQIGWKHLPLRSQDTLYEWVIEPDGTITAMKQENPNTFEIIEIPMDNLLLFRTSLVKNNPEGRSVLRTAYTSWFRKKRIESIEGDRKSTRLNSSHIPLSRMPSSA